MKYSPEIIGKKIKEERIKKNWSQEALGKIIGVSGKQISNYEKAIQTPPIDVLFSLCENFECELGFLLGEEKYESGTKLDTAIEEKLKLSKKAIASICHLTGSDRSCFFAGHNAESFRKALNSLLCSEEFAYLLLEMDRLDEAIQKSKKIWQALYEKYGEEKMKQAFEYDRSTIDYLRDQNAEKIDDEYYEILGAINTAVDKEYEASYPIKLRRYEVREAFESLLDTLYPKYKE